MIAFTRARNLKYLAFLAARFSWLVESPATEAWGLGCKFCALSTTSSSSCSPWKLYKKGQAGVLQVKDFQDHEMSNMHKQALELTSALPVASTSSSCGPSTSSSCGPSTSPESSCPTAGLIRLSIEVASCPVGAQGLESNLPVRNRIRLF